LSEANTAARRTPSARRRFLGPLLLLMAVAIGTVVLVFVIVPPTPPSGRPIDEYELVCGPCPSGRAFYSLEGDGHLATYKRLSALLLKAVAATPTSVSIDSCEVEGSTGVASNPSFVWLPADRSVFLPGPVSSRASITRVEALLGEWFDQQQPLVLVSLGLPCEALEYRIDSATMAQIAETLFPRQ
jgi:hypothetical protein